MVRSRRTSGRSPLRNKLLTLEERRSIDQSLEQGLKMAVIARMLDQSFYSVCTYKRKGTNYGQKKPTGRPPLLGTRIRRHIQRLISNKFYTLKEIQVFLLSNGISNVSLMTVILCLCICSWFHRQNPPTCLVCEQAIIHNAQINKRSALHHRFWAVRPHLGE